MQGATDRRWGRVLLVIVALFGLVAMHATIAPTHVQATPAPAMAASADSGHDVLALLSFGAHEGAAAAPPSGVPGDDPMSVPHALMHLCLAVMAAGIVLGLVVAGALMVLFGGTATPRLPVARVAVRPSRPPVRTAVRLAELCVLRN